MPMLPRIKARGKYRLREVMNTLRSEMRCGSQEREQKQRLVLGDDHIREAQGQSS